MKILITGGASGLGESITTALASQFSGAEIVITRFASETSAAELCKRFPNVSAMRVDFTSADDIVSICSFITEQKFDVLVNNALSQMPVNHFHKTEPAVYAAGFRENILPVLEITRAFLRVARNRRSGRVITVLSSALAGMPVTGHAGYIAEKQYLHSMAMSWAAENAAFNIQSNCISPAFMDTPLHDGLNESVKSGMRESHPLKRLLTVGEVAGVVSFLISAPDHLNGQNIFLNAGKI